MDNHLKLYFLNQEKLVVQLQQIDDDISDLEKKKQNLRSTQTYLTSPSSNLTTQKLWKKTGCLYLKHDQKSLNTQISSNLKTTEEQLHTKKTSREVLTQAVRKSMSQDVLSSHFGMEKLTTQDQDLFLPHSLQ
ncbi:hypothetical protein BLNAU_8174 [Blattamonas nauphoetae]|uniref:Uncharacterized protein n=1 Tax=Blattamonas nauphoetae TaxID=2049346 RepID=A0ABQ9XZF4_9EUKA|nr:hypothetical protein BLNAU_8174 [Blattamonas nauphoetae]